MIVSILLFIFNLMKIFGVIALYRVAVLQSSLLYKMKGRTMLKACIIGLTLSFGESILTDLPTSVFDAMGIQMFCVLVFAHWHEEQIEVDIPKSMEDSRRIHGMVIDATGDVTITYCDRYGIETDVEDGSMYLYTPEAQAIYDQVFDSLSNDTKHYTEVLDLKDEFKLSTVEDYIERWKLTRLEQIKSGEVVYHGEVEL